MIVNLVAPKLLGTAKKTSDKILSVISFCWVPYSTELAQVKIKEDHYGTSAFFFLPYYVNM